MTDDILLPKKIEKMRTVFFVLGFFIFMGLDSNKITEMRWAAGIFLGFLIIFIVTIIIKDVISKIDKFSKNILKKYDEEISESILKEQKEKNFKNKIQIINEREILYEQANQTSSGELYISLKNGFFALILSIALSLFPTFKILTIEHFQIIYFLLIFGVYYSCKIIFILLEIL